MGQIATKLKHLDYRPKKITVKNFRLGEFITSIREAEDLGYLFKES